MWRVYSHPQRDREYQDTVQGVQRRQCNTSVQWIWGLLRTSPFLHFPSVRWPFSKVLCPAFTVQADETIKLRVEWSEMFCSYIERHQRGLYHPSPLCQPLSAYALPPLLPPSSAIVSILETPTPSQNVFSSPASSTLAPYSPDSAPPAPALYASTPFVNLS